MLSWIVRHYRCGLQIETKKIAEIYRYVKYTLSLIFSIIDLIILVFVVHKVIVSVQVQPYQLIFNKTSNISQYLSIVK